MYKPKQHLIEVTSEGYLSTGSLRTDRRLQHEIDERAEAAFTHELFEWAVKDSGSLPSRLYFRLQIAHDLRVVLDGLGDWIHASPEDLLM